MKNIKYKNNIKPLEEDGKSNGKYPPHKITTYNVHKTSSIYDVKFILMWQHLHEHCWFYIQHLPKKFRSI